MLAEPLARRNVAVAGVCCSGASGEVPSCLLPGPSTPPRRETKTWGGGGEAGAVQPLCSRRQDTGAALPVRVRDQGPARPEWAVGLGSLLLRLRGLPDRTGVGGHGRGPGSGAVKTREDVFFGRQKGTVVWGRHLKLLRKIRL